MMGRTLGGGVRTELEANLNAAGALERYQYWSDKLERLLQQQRSRARHNRNLQVITSRAARDGARGRVCFAKKPCAATEMASVNNHRAAALQPSPPRPGGGRLELVA